MAVPTGSEMKPIALIKTGSTIGPIKSEHGDFEDWFAAGTGVEDLLQVDVYKQQPLPEPSQLSGVLITGSAAMVSAREDWSERCARWLTVAVEAHIPILGVCYGHQLLAHALGGRVGPNPNGRQIGTTTAQLLKTAANDPLLGHLPQKLEVQTSHSESVLELPADAERLASSPLDDNFAMRFARNVWGVQFHPEFSAAVMTQYVKLRAVALREEGLKPEQLVARVKATEKATTVLQRFAEIVLSHDSADRIQS